MRLRLAEVPTTQATPEPRFLLAGEGAAIAGTSPRWLLAKTKGMKLPRGPQQKAATIS